MAGKTKQTKSIKAPKPPSQPHLSGHPERDDNPGPGPGFGPHHGPFPHQLDPNKVWLPKNGTVLFQGDSIVAWQRDLNDPTSLGSGFALYCASFFGAMNPGRNITFLNRGVNGNTTGDLLARWQTDTIDLNPDVLSILVGINDVWANPTGPLDPDISLFVNNYRQLLTWTRQALPHCSIILMEPFNWPSYSTDMASWRTRLDAEIDAVRSLAAEFHTHLVLLDGPLNKGVIYQPATWWSYDGIHPKPPGNGLISRQWLDIVH